MLTILPLTGCATFFKTTPARYGLIFDAAAQVNIMADERPAPIKISILVLKSDTEFLATDFFSLQRDPQGALGDKLLDRSQFFLMPGQTGKALNGELEPEARYIGVVAEYQNFDGKIWRVLLSLPDPEKTKFHIAWPFQRNELKAHIVADVNGLHVEKESD